MLPQRELATVLAALRFCQRHGPLHLNSLWDRLEVDEQDALDAVRSDGGRTDPPDLDEIDVLCKRLNGAPPLTEWVQSCRTVSESAEQWAECSDRGEAAAVFRDVGRQCRALVERLIVSGWTDLVELCDCELPGHFYSGVPGIIARFVDGQLAPDAAVERCDACERYPSDEAALEKLRELGYS